MSLAIPLLWQNYRTVPFKISGTYPSSSTRPCLHPHPQFFVESGNPFQSTPPMLCSKRSCNLPPPLPPSIVKIAGFLVGPTPRQLYKLIKSWPHITQTDVSNKTRIYKYMHNICQWVKISSWISLNPNHPHMSNFKYIYIIISAYNYFFCTKMKE